MTIKKKRILIAATVLIGVSVGLIIQDYLHNVASFSLGNHVSSIALIIGMILFIAGHLWGPSEANKVS
jgi:hypothetical protein